MWKNAGESGVSSFAACRSMGAIVEQKRPQYFLDRSFRQERDFSRGVSGRLTDGSGFLPVDLLRVFAGVRWFGRVAIRNLRKSCDVARPGDVGRAFAQHLRQAIETFRAGIAQRLVGGAQQ